MTDHTLTHEMTPVRGEPTRPTGPNTISARVAWHRAEAAQLEQMESEILSERASKPAPEQVKLEKETRIVTCDVDSPAHKQCLAEGFQPASKETLDRIAAIEERAQRETTAARRLAAKLRDDELAAQLRREKWSAGLGHEAI